jgi:glycogen(starch) synthase
MAGSHLGSIRRKNFPITTIFTTHATYLGRCLAINDENFYNHLPYYQWHDEAKKLNIEPQNLIERTAAHAAHVFTTVSEITGLECKYLIGREVDLTLPNGLNIERFVAEHEFQNLHQIYKNQINRFTMAHFFPSYSFDLDHTLYFFTSGRYEYKNKGFDLTLEVLARLNWKLKQIGSPLTIVVFFITKSPTHYILPEALAARALMDEIKKTTEAIQSQVGERLFESAASGEIPALDDLVDEYWTLRLRRNLQAWKTKKLPPVITHQLVSESQDAILNQIRNCQLINKPDDKVKIVYHPDFISANNPLFGMDYDQFVRGCHMGIFPSYYEPWGYTPLECIARGIPAVTSDLSGFGAYLLKYMPDYQDKGIYVSKRRLFSWDEAANQLADYLFDFVKMNRRERIKMRNHVEGISDHFDWSNLGRFYDTAYALAEKRFLG